MAMTQDRLPASRLIQVYASLMVLAVVWGNAFEQSGMPSASRWK